MDRGVFQGSFKGVSGKFKGFSRGLQGTLKGGVWKIQRCIMSVSKEFQESLEGLTKKIIDFALLSFALLAANRAERGLVFIHFLISNFPEAKFSLISFSNFTQQRKCGESNKIRIKKKQVNQSPSLMDLKKTPSQLVQS